ncbi:queuosine precursor transporter [Niabella ginsengisoli]|uniref:Probable queuosine precursor transporter n=1 Tax=Niabella ginsengisoli TaxID=522298 RepID=A0ABS9SEP1_9BACT|nr:queuosine precursor transporter [Niabella ginsengisoli]MCH5596827.1 queuosine precursor transporter [Niabella ginsengisoli]
MIRTIIGDKSTRLFIVLGGFFIANAIVAEVIGVKIFSLEKTIGIQPFDLTIFGNNFSFNLTAGVLLWPVVFIMTDIINEYYGVKGVRFLSFLAAGLIAYTFIMFQGAIALSPADFWTGNYKAQHIDDANEAYRVILGQGSWIIIGSLAAFLIGQILDVVVFHSIKRATGEKAIWLRATGSTLVSQLVDSFVVLFIAFYIGPRVSGNQGTPWSLNLVLAICVGNYIYKFIVAVVMTPVIYLVHWLIERYLGATVATEMKREAMGKGS